MEGNYSLIVQLWKTHRYFAFVTILCRNCNQSFSEEYQHCPHCGQKANLQRLTLHNIFHDFVHAFTHFDKGILLLLRYLTIRPGKIPREYVDGKRKKYFNPFSFLVLMVGVAFFLVLKFESLAFRHEDLASANTEILHFSFKYFNIFIFLMAPVNALLSWLLFRKYKFFYAEYLVLWAYLTGQQMFYYCLFIVLALIPPSLTVTGTVVGILMSIWFVFALIQFHQQKSLANVVKAIIVVIISQVLLQATVYVGFYLFGPVAAS
jgi:hypothetical protein